MMMGMGMGGPIQITEEQRARMAERAATAKANQEPAPDEDLKFAENGVTEEMMIEYITSRHEVLERARYKVRLQHSQMKSLQSRLDLSEKKGQTLRDAMAKLREELKAAKAEIAELKAQLAELKGEEPAAE